MHRCFKRSVIESAGIRGRFSLIITLIWAFVAVTLVRADLQGRADLPQSRFGTVNIDVGPYVQFTGPRTAVVRWDTPETHDSIVEYWTNESMSERAKDSTATTAHEITLSDLQYRSRYFYRVGYTNGEKELFTDIYTFDNAINYTPAEGRVIISAHQEKGLLQIRVEDTGVGISPTDQARLFEKFYQVRKKEGGGEVGSGLGLAIVKSIVEQHGGRVKVESKLGSGSAFTIEIPFHEE